MQLSNSPKFQELFILARLGCTYGSLVLKDVVGSGRCEEVGAA